MEFKGSGWDIKNNTEKLSICSYYIHFINLTKRHLYYFTKDPYDGEALNRSNIVEQTKLLLNNVKVSFCLYHNLPMKT